MKTILSLILMILSLNSFSQSSFEKCRHYVAEQIVCVDSTVDILLDATDERSLNTLNILRRSEDYSNVRYFVEGFYMHLYIQCFFEVYTELYGDKKLSQYFLTTENQSFMYELTNIEVCEYILQVYDDFHQNDSYVKFIKSNYERLNGTEIENW